MSYCMRLILCIIFLAMLDLTFGLGVGWIATHILSEFWSSILIILFTSSAFVVAVLIISIFIR